MIYFAAFPSPPQCSVPKEVLVWILVLPQLEKVSAKGEGGGTQGGNREFGQLEAGRSQVIHGGQARPRNR